MRKEAKSSDNSESESAETSPSSSATSVDFVPFDVFFKKQYRCDRHHGEHLYDAWKRKEARRPPQREDLMAKFVDDIRKSLLAVKEVAAVETTIAGEDESKRDPKALAFRTFVDIATDNSQQVDCRGGRFLVKREKTTRFEKKSTPPPELTASCTTSEVEPQKRRPALMIRKPGAKKPLHILRDW